LAGRSNDYILEQEKPMTRMNEGGGQDQGQQEGQAGGAQIRETASQVGQNLRDMGGQVRDAAKEQYDHLRQQATDYYEQGRNMAHEWENQLENYVQEQPVKALMIAAGVGLLVGLLWRR
jgi:ElaB/YqjD/DUF883 family membrane-anchored ribosome-binding protein